MHSTGMTSARWRTKWSREKQRKPTKYATCQHSLWDKGAGLAGTTCHPPGFSLRSEGHVYSCYRIKVLPGGNDQSPALLFIIAHAALSGVCVHLKPWNK